MRLAFLCATRTDSDATVGYYGVGLDNLLGERQNISKPLLLHIATRDKFSSPEAQAKVRAALKDNPLVTIWEITPSRAAAAARGCPHWRSRQMNGRKPFLPTSSPEAGLCATRSLDRNWKPAEAGRPRGRLPRSL